MGWLVGWLVIISYIYGALTLMTKMEHGLHYFLSWPYLFIIAFANGSKFDKGPNKQRIFVMTK